MRALRSFAAFVATGAHALSRKRTNIQAGRLPLLGTTTDELEQCGAQIHHHSRHAKPICDNQMTSGAAAVRSSGMKPRYHMQREPNIAPELLSSEDALPPIDEAAVLAFVKKPLDPRSGGRRAQGIGVGKARYCIPAVTEPWQQRAGRKLAPPSRKHGHVPLHRPAWHPSTSLPSATRP